MCRVCEGEEGVCQEYVRECVRKKRVCEECVRLAGKTVPGGLLCTLHSSLSILPGL